MDGSGKVSRTSGSASVSVLTRISRRSARKPPMVGSVSRSSHKGERLVTEGMRVKLCGDGGEEVAHSSVSESHGLGPAGAPRNTVRAMFHNNSRKLKAKTIAPMVESRFSPPQGISAE